MSVASVVALTAKTSQKSETINVSFVPKQQQAHIAATASLAAAAAAPATTTADAATTAAVPNAKLNIHLHYNPASPPVASLYCLSLPRDKKLAAATVVEISSDAAVKPKPSSSPLSALSACCSPSHYLDFSYSTSSSSSSSTTTPATLLVESSEASSVVRREAASDVYLARLICLSLPNLRALIDSPLESFTPPSSVQSTRSAGTEASTKTQLSPSPLLSPSVSLITASSEAAATVQYKDLISNWISLISQLESLLEVTSSQSKSLESSEGNRMNQLIKKAFSDADSYLTRRTYIVGHHLSLADVGLYACVGKVVGFNNLVSTSASSTSAISDAFNSNKKLFGLHNLNRWFRLIHTSNFTSPKILKSLAAAYPSMLSAVSNSTLTTAAADAVGASSMIASSPQRNASKGGSAAHQQQQQQPQQQCSTATTSTTTAAVTEQRSEVFKLPGAVRGQVTVRFCPEPSGYLHIGHAKAALLNAYYATAYEGKLLIRFDDTNPSKEKMEYEESIVEDLRLLNICPQVVSRTSDYFPQIEELCERLIREGLLYCDDTPVELMRIQRGEGIESACRSNSIEENLKRWSEMKKGSFEGIKNCVRAKIDMQSKNKCMRDPVMYRCVTGIPHHIHGTKYKVYPCYDFACPIVDSLEGVTHALRANEYADRIPQYNWVLNVCKFPPVVIYEFSRLNLVNTVLSKRKLQWLVDCGAVNSWDDPRFPTVRGISRRGLIPAALMDFIMDLGHSKNVNLMEWDKLWARNKQLIDPVAPRFFAVDASNAVSVCLTNGPDGIEVKQRSLHPKNAAMGEVEQLYSNQILIEREDAEMLELNEELTLMRWCNAFVESIEREDGQIQQQQQQQQVEEQQVEEQQADQQQQKFDEKQRRIRQVRLKLNPSGDFKKTKKKLHWVACSEAAPSSCAPVRVILREYDHIISKRKPEDEDLIEEIYNRDSVKDTEGLAESTIMKAIIEGDIIQFERRGYFRLDRRESEAAATSAAASTKNNDYDGNKNLPLPVFIKIPDGKSKSMSVIEGKVDVGKLAKGN